MKPRRSPVALVALLLAAALAPSAPAQRRLRDVPEPDIEAELASFELAEGSEISLFAADPMVAKPIQMNFDPAGRVWVASSPIYPQLLPGAAPADRVLVLEDADGDGRADSSTVFAEGLLIPTAVIPGDGGAYVANSTELLHLRDTDGDGRADERRVVLSGFGTEDTHHILHTLRWGPDGFLYFNQSIYIHSHVETPHGVRRLYAGGIWQFRPATMELDVFVRGMVNGWGHQFDRWGQQFGADGAYFEGILYFIPGASYASAHNARRVVPGLNPGSPKYCGVEVLSGRHLPEAWRGNVVACDFRANRVSRFRLDDAGAGYTSTQLADLARSRRVTFRPIDVKMGPDGAIWVADWYNPIIQHGEVDFRDPRRDHDHGRIWRITVRGRPLVDRPRLAGAPIAELVKRLAAPEYWTRHQARRALSERPATEVVPALAAWIEGLDPDDDAHEHRLLEALWTYQTVDVVDEPLLARLLAAREPRARAAAARVLGHWHARVSDPLGSLARLVEDDAPRVRLEAVRALGRILGARSAKIAMRALDRPLDPFLEYGLWLTANELADAWLTELRAGRPVFGGDARRLEFALTALGSREAVAPLRELVERGGVSSERTGRVLGLIARLGGPDDLALVLDRVLDRGALAETARAEVLGALVEVAREKGTRPSGDLARLKTLLESEVEPLRVEALRLAGLWKAAELRRAIVAVARASATAAALHAAALDGLVALGGAESVEALERLLDSSPREDASLRIIAALVALDPRRGAEHAVGRFTDAELAGGDPTAVFRAFFARTDGPAVLLEALRARAVLPDAAKVGLRVAQTSRVEAPELVELLRAAAGEGVWQGEIAGDGLARLVVEVAERGDPQRGEAVFRRRGLDCLTCHAIGGAGGQVGPDLSSLGGAATVDALIESLVLPNKTVKENYHSNVVVTRGGEVITGIPVAESQETLVLRTAEGDERRIDKGAIVQRQVSGSIMAEGLVDPLTRGELLDLVRFLAALGKEDGFTVDGAQRARRWRLIDDPPQDLAIDSLERIGELLRDREHAWVPAYSRADGVLPLSDLADVERWGYAFARAEIEVGRAGGVKLVIGDGTSGLSIWLDAKPLDVEGELAVDLAPGKHTLDVRVKLSKQRRGLAIALAAAPRSRADARFVGGR